MSVKDEHFKFSDTSVKTVDCRLLTLFPLNFTSIKFCEKINHKSSGVSISFCASGYLKVTGGYICRRPEGCSTLEGSGGMFPRKILKF